MPTSESERHALREKLTGALGSETAGNLMEHIPPMRWDELATKTDLHQMADQLTDKMATKEDLRQLADKMATKDDLHQMADLLRKERRADLQEVRGEMHKEFGAVHGKFGAVHQKFGEMHDKFGEMQDRSAERQTQLVAMLIGQHRTTMLMLAGVLVATVASVLIPLLTSSPA